jgi:hypothetical protein
VNKTLAEIKEEYKKHYETKQVQWKEEDIYQQELKQKDKESKRLNQKFMRGNAKKHRKAQLFMDNYSKKDEAFMRNLLNINNILDKKLYDSKKVEKALDEYINIIEKENSMEGAKKDKDPYQELVEKIKKRLKNEKVSEYNLIRDSEEIYPSFNQGQNFPDGGAAAKRKEEGYQAFLDFKKKVIEDEKSNKCRFENNKPKDHNILRSASFVKKYDFTNYLNQTPSEIIQNLRRHSIERKMTINNLAKLRSQKNSNLLLN